MDQAAPRWFRVAISEGLIRLVALSLPGQPPSETIELTKEAWIDALHRGRVWVDDDAVRIAAGFRALAAKVDRWPVPRMLIDNLPARPERAKIEAPRLSPKECEKNRQRIRDMMYKALKVIPQ